VPLVTRARRRRIATAASDLLTLLEASSGAADGPSVRELLRDVLAAIDARHDEWPEP
jgi:hypothetical protein